MDSHLLSRPKVPGRNTLCWPSWLPEPILRELWEPCTAPSSPLSRRRVVQKKHLMRVLPSSRVPGTILAPRPTSVTVLRRGPLLEDLGKPILRLALPPCSSPVELNQSTSAVQEGIWSSLSSQCSLCQSQVWRDLAVFSPAKVLSSPRLSTWLPRSPELIPTRTSPLPSWTPWPSYPRLTEMVESPAQWTTAPSPVPVLVQSDRGNSRDVPGRIGELIDLIIIVK